MAWIAVDRDGDENMFSCRPKRWHNGICALWSTQGKGDKVKLFKGAIKEKYGLDMDWNSEPVKVK